MKAKIRLTVTAAVLGGLLSLPQLSMADELGTYGSDQGTRAVAMTVDALLVRPAMFGVTVVGAAVFLVSLPFSALGGNVGEAAKTLVVGPGETTFVRCLGCTRNGRHHSTVANDDDVANY